MLEQVRLTSSPALNVAGDDLAGDEVIVVVECTESGYCRVLIKLII